MNQVLSCYVKCHLDIGQNHFKRYSKYATVDGKKSCKRKNCFRRSKALLFPQCITPKCWAPLLRITIMRTHCNFVALKKQDGVELSVGQMASILTFNFSTCKEEITSTFCYCWRLSLSKCLAQRRCSVSNHSIIFFYSWGIISTWNMALRR